MLVLSDFLANFVTETSPTVDRASKAAMWFAENALNTHTFQESRYDEVTTNFFSTEYHWRKKYGRYKKSRIVIEMKDCSSRTVSKCCFDPS